MDFRRLILCYALSLFVPLVVRAAVEDCVEGERCKVEVLEVRPTQSRVGLKEVELKLDDIREALDGEKDDVKKFLKRQSGRAVIGPKGKIYLIDGHHFAVALEKLGVESMYVEIEKDWSHLSEREFWRKMRKKQWVYLESPAGGKVAVEDLPKSVRGLRDEPHRTLAWMLRKAGGFEDLEVPFQEFEWAKFLRKRCPIASSQITSYRSALVCAMDLARSKKTRDLPGYLGKDAGKYDGCNLRQVFAKLFL